MTSAKAGEVVRRLLRQRKVRAGLALAVVGGVVYHFNLLAPFVVWLLFAAGVSQRAESLPPPRAADAPVLADDAADGSVYDVEPCQANKLPYGVPPAELAAHGFAHPVIKVLPQIDAGDLDRVPGPVMRNSRRFFYVVAAGVAERPGPGGAVGYELARVGIGQGVRLDQGELIIDGTAEDSPANQLGLAATIFRMLNEERVKAIRVTVRSSRLAVLDVPLYVRHDGVHRRGWRRLAILVCPRTGRLETLMWFLGPGPGGDLQFVGPVYRLAPGRVEECSLFVNAREFALGLPTERSIALVDWPKGEWTLAVPDAAEELLGRRRYTREAAPQLDQLLRGLIDAPARAAAP